MAVKVKKAVAKKKTVAKAVATKKAVAKKPVAKKAVAKKPAGKPAVMKGDRYECRECGMIITVDETCGCVGFHPIICCEEEMTPKKAKAKK
jgi:hypothetical protein